MRSAKGDAKCGYQYLTTSSVKANSIIVKVFEIDKRINAVKLMKGKRI